MKKKLNLAPAMFIGPHLILFLVFIVLPTIYGIYASFTQWNLAGSPNWVGFANYKTILFDTSSTFHFQFFNGLKNTLLFVLFTVPPLIVLPLMIAVALSHKKLKGKTFIQSVLYVPGLISISASALIFTLIFNKQLGITNNVFGSTIAWATHQPYAWITIVVLTIWGGIGGNMIIYRASISGVAEELYESAGLDGAGPIRKFFSITLPSINFPLIYTFVMTTAASFNVFGQPLIMTDGGPQQSTSVLMMYIRQLAFGSGESIAGMASAMAVLLGIVILIVSALQYYVMNRNAN